MTDRVIHDPQARSARPTGVFRVMRRFSRDQSGTPAIEFAFVVPILVALLLSAVEITNALQVVRRGTTAATVLADLVSREVEITDLNTYVAELDGVAEEIFEPFDAPISFHVAHIYFDASGAYDVASAASWQVGQTPGSPNNICNGEALTAPTDMDNAGVHDVAPEFRAIWDNAGTPGNSSDDIQLRPDLLADGRDGSMVVVRVRYCYEALLIGVLPDIIGPREVVATYAPRNNTCIPTQNGGSPVNDCTSVASFDDTVPSS